MKYYRMCLVVIFLVTQIHPYILQKKISGFKWFVKIIIYSYNLNNSYLNSYYSTQLTSFT